MAAVTEDVDVGVEAAVVMQVAVVVVEVGVAVLALLGALVVP